MEAKAVARFVRMSPRKIRRVAELIRGKNVGEAINILHFTRKAATEPLEKALRSAVANMLNVEGSSKVDPDTLYIKELRVDEGITLRRFRAASMGRAVRIRKRTSHITVKVAEVEK
ncbi:MAG: 50S ribosomal protein L22 [candidate division KSB1 bacterium]|nr:50S ribosomal protein L22 [candidate division KSB1 bacterium]MDZ7334663.1 50S ribosomal protein L22 [candidate division KSB1 bacterium]MDZ7399478.1 50S ribosomal protein L22 [candidate division KSB1 bacterium]